MLTFDELEEKLKAARQYEQTVAGITFTIRIPSRAELRGLYSAVRGEDQEQTITRIASTGAVVRAAVVGQHGATLMHIGLDGEDELPTTAEAAQLLLAERLDIADELHGELMRRIRLRGERLEATEKNY